MASKKLTELVGLDAAAKVLAATMKQGLPALLIGETGTGKTSLAQDVAQALGRDVARVNLDGGSTVEDLKGCRSLKDGSTGSVTGFDYGVIPKAMGTGAVLVLDEINAALPDTLFLLHPLLERPARFYIPETAEDVSAAAGFAVVATMNPSHEYAGTKALNAALYSRFATVIRFEPLGGERLVQALGQHVPQADAEQVGEVAHVLEAIEDLRRAERIVTRATIREGIAALLLGLDGISLKDAIRYCIVSKLELPEQEQLDRTYRPPSTNGHNKWTVEELLTRAVNYDKVVKQAEQVQQEVLKYARVAELLRTLDTANKAASTPQPEPV